MARTIDDLIAMEMFTAANVTRLRKEEALQERRLSAAVKLRLLEETRLANLREQLARLRCIEI